MARLADVGSRFGTVAPLTFILAEYLQLGSADPMLLVALVAAVAARGLSRRAVGGAGLSALGAIAALAAAWLVPQRPDRVSMVLVAVLFGVGAGIACSLRDGHVVGDFLDPVRGVGVVAALALLAAGAETALLVLAVAQVSVAAVARADHRGRQSAGVYRPHRFFRVASVGLLVVLVGGGYVGYVGASTVSVGWFGGGVTHGDRRRNEVALTFDDGPNVTASLQIARILDDRGAKGTFFLVGKAMAARPDLVRALYADGQLLGNHSYHHDSWRWLVPSYPELARTDAEFAKVLGTCPAFYRPPHGQRTPFVRKVADDRGERLVMWDVSATDWVPKDPKVIADRVLSRVRPGSIIDLHDSLDGNTTIDRTVLVKAMPMILEGLAAKGLKVVRLDQLIGGAAYRKC